MATYSKVLSRGGGNYRLDLVVNQASQNIANNTSTVNWSLTIYKTAGSGYWSNYTSSWSVNIGGQTKSGSISSYDFRSSTSKALGSGSVTISHNADGGKSITSSGTFTDGGSSGIGSGTASGSLTLTTIPRASSFGTISGSTLGSGITVNINRASSSFTHSMWYSFGSATWQGIGSGIGTSTTFTPPLTLGSQIPNTTSGTMTLILRTMSGSTQIGGDVTKTINVGLPSSVVPSAGTLSAVQGNSNNAGTYVQGFSSVKLTASGYAGSYGSTIKSVQITGAGHTFNANTGTTGVLNNSGNVQFTSTITDSRGRKSYAYVTVNFLPYSPPQIVSASVQRTNASGVATWNGTYMKYTYHVKVSSLMVGGVQKNNVKIVYFDYGANGTNWGNATHTTVIEASGNKTYGTISVTSSVPARINAYDNMGRYATWTGQVSAGTVALDIGDSNIGVGKFWEQGTIDASGQIYQNNGYAVGNGYIGNLPSGDCNSYVYWQNIAPGVYSSGDQSQLTNGKGSWSIVRVERMANIASGTHARVFWLTQSDIIHYAFVTGSVCQWHTTLTRSDLGNLYTPIVLRGTASENRLITRGIQGSDGNGNLGDLYINNGNTNKVYINGQPVNDFVVSRGTNFIQWNSGTMECWGQISATGAITTALGSGYRLVVGAISFPVTFVSTPNVQLTAHNYANPSINSVSSSQLSVNLTSYDSGRVAGKVDYRAIGRWK